MWKLLNSHSLVKTLAVVLANIQVCLPDATRPGSLFPQEAKASFSEILLSWESVPLSPGLVGEQKPLQNVEEALGS